MVADVFVGGTRGVTDVLDVARDNLVSIVTDGIRVGFVGSGD